MPFATVKYSDAKNHDIVYYTKFTDLTGKYDLGKNVPPRDYHITIEAPGYCKREKTIGRLPDHFDSEFTLHYRLDKADGRNPASVEKISGKSLKKSVKQVKGVISYLGFKDTGSEIHAPNGDKVQFLFNGVSLSDNTTINKILDLPIKYLKEVEVYTIEDRSTPFPFGKVVNIIIAGERTAEYNGKLNGTPGETSYFDIR